MKNAVAGVKTTLISLVVFSCIFLAVVYSQSYWLPWQSYFTGALYAGVAITALFAAQFSQSRFSLLAIYLLLVLLSNQIKLPVLSLWQQNPLWQLNSCLFVFVFLAYVKDRGLLSIHLTYRIIGLILCIAGAYGWLAGADALLTHYQIKQQAPENLMDYQATLTLYLPMALSLLLVLIRSFYSSQLFQPALLITCILQCLAYFELLPLTWLVVLLCLIVFYLLTVITRSYLLAYRDELTGLSSRRALYQFALSLGRKYSVAMMDIDHFKKFNDTYGHDIGDQVLKLVAAKLSKVKGGGRVYRYGGEEFTVIFPRKHAEQTIAELEKLRQSIADYKMVIRQANRKGKDGRQKSKADNSNTVSVTISIGVATRQSKQSFDQVMKAADEKLYQAKKNGRNNVSQ